MVFKQIISNNTDKEIGVIYSISPGEIVFVIDKKTKKVIRKIRYEDAVNERKLVNA
jgi:uncharacterized FlaG/YvyC family protein